MYPELYQKWFKLALNPAELVLMEILMRTVGLLAKATLGHLANNLPLPIGSPGFMVISLADWNWRS